MFDRTSQSMFCLVILEGIETARPRDDDVHRRANNSEQCVDNITMCICIR